MPFISWKFIIRPNQYLPVANHGIPITLRAEFRYPLNIFLCCYINLVGSGFNFPGSKLDGVSNSGLNIFPELSEPPHLIQSPEITLETRVKITKVIINEYLILRNSIISYTFNKGENVALLVGNCQILPIFLCLGENNKVYVQFRNRNIVIIITVG
jgi:hypothetical protein